MSGRIGTVCWLAIVLAACADEQGAEGTLTPVPRSNALTRGRSNFVGLFNPTTATWRLKMQRPGWAGEPITPDLVFRFGDAGSLPVVGDWDGNGTQTPGTFLAGNWALVDTLGDGQATHTFAFGGEGDTPLAGDWDGDGRASPGVFRDGVFQLRNDASGGPADWTIRFGRPGDHPAVGDWDGDGVDTLGVYRPSDSTFHLINRLDNVAPLRGASVSGCRPSGRPRA